MTEDVPTHVDLAKDFADSGVAEVLRLVFERKLAGPLLQSQVPAAEFLSGPFVLRAYGAPG